jgi:hypothetical protein
MPKLPDNFVTAPSFDNPLRSTAPKNALVERRLMLRLDQATWDILLTVSERENTTPEALVQRALDRWLSDPQPAAPAARSVETARPGLRAQLIERLQQRFVKKSWVQRLLAMREMLQEGRA